jgi:hypothetical protein
MISQNPNRRVSESPARDERLHETWPAHKSTQAGETKSFYESQLYHEWYGRVATGDPNDFVIAISAHPGYTGVSGSGKTTLGGGLAKNYLDHSSDGFDGGSQYTVDVSVLAYELYGESEELATLVADEMQGTAATTNLNSKRSMKTESLAAYNTIAGNRKGRKTLILIFQTLDKAMKDMFDFVDAWLLIVDDVKYRCNHYKVLPEPFNFESNKTKTPRVETISWESLPADDPDYQLMEEKKDEANAGVREYGEDGDDESDEMRIPKAARDDKIRALYDQGIPQKKIAAAFGITQQAVSGIVNS